MMQRVSSYQKLITFTFFLLTLGNSSFLTAKGFSKYFEYSGYIFLLTTIFFRFAFDKKLFKKSRLSSVYSCSVLDFLPTVP